MSYFNSDLALACSTRAISWEQSENHWENKGEDFSYRNVLCFLLDTISLLRRNFSKMSPQITLLLLSFWGWEEAGVNWRQRDVQSGTTMPRFLRKLFLTKNRASLDKEKPFTSIANPLPPINIETGFDVVGPRSQAKVLTAGNWKSSNAMGRPWGKTKIEGLSGL